MLEDGKDPSGEGLREATFTAVRWISFARVAGEVLVFAKAVLLARLIPPADFGRAAIALILVALAATMLGGILGPRIVQRKEHDPVYAESAAWMGIVCGLVLAIAAWFGGPPLATALLDAETGDLVRLASPTFLLAGLAVAPQAVMQRRIDFRRLSSIEVAAAAGGTGVGVALALSGMDGEAIILGALAGQAVSTGGALLVGPRVRPRLNVAAVRDLLGFGVPAGIGSLGYLTFRNVDYAIIGARLGAAPLGAYWRAYQLGVEYQKKISIVMLRVAFPVYSRTRDLAEMRRIRTRIVRMHAATIFPLLALLIALGPQVIPFIYGPNWDAAVVPAQILAVGGMATAVQTGIGPLMMALGKTKPLMTLTWVALTLYIAIVYLVAPLGIVPVSIAVVCVGLANLTAGNLLLRRYAGIPMRALIGEAGGSTAAAIALMAIAYPIAQLLSSAGAADGLAIAAAAPPALAVYAAVVRWLSPGAWSDGKLMVRRVLRRTAPPAPAPAGA